MAVLIHRRSKEGTPDILEEAVCWTLGPLTLKLWADEDYKKLLCEFTLGEVVRLEFPDTALKSYTYPKQKKLGEDLIKEKEKK